MIVLGIETSDILCSVAWVKDDRILLEMNMEERNAHASRLAVLVEKGCDELKLTVKDIGLISVATGPGSFTGLRIGMAYAKGLAYANRIPLVGITNFEVLALQGGNRFPVVTVIDAGRKSFYYAYFTREGSGIDRYGKIDSDSLSDHIPAETVVVLYQRQADLPGELASAAYTIRGEYGARYLGRIGSRKIGHDPGEGLETVEPLYITEFAGAT